ncbi:unnamed protein product [Soboliphyme baturini]|uniref:Uncharacterized protein n=1 Tax=Soboliphyme baturini TaxID=241478 RepID=A0A183J8K9_9BILA|nr:unnamed protein product [Soboliphyme baturini]
MEMSPACDTCLWASGLTLSTEGKMTRNDAEDGRREADPDQQRSSCVDQRSRRQELSWHRQRSSRHGPSHNPPQPRSGSVRYLRRAPTDRPPDRPTDRRTMNVNEERR